MRLALVVLVLGLCTAFQGCSTPSVIPELPRTLADKGLLVARLYVPGSSLWDNAQINIDGKLSGANLRDGYVAIALPPGEHRFVQLRVEGQQLTRYDPADQSFLKAKGGGSYHYYYIPGGSTIIHFTTLSVNRTFTIEAGKITNLGLLVYLSADDPTKQHATVDQRKEYYTIPVDNNAEISTYLETNYPDLMATLQERAPRLASGGPPYLAPAKLPDLRRAIATLESRAGKLITTGTVAVAYGDAGTLVSIKMGTDRKPVIDVLDTGTLANIVDARSSGERLLFLTSNARILALEQGKLAQISVPERIQPLRMAAPNASDLIIVDNRMRILTSRDLGRTWTKYEGAMLERPRNDIGLAQDDDGAYVSLGSTGVPTSILYVQAGATAPRQIPAPQQQGVPGHSRNVLVARKAGLFIISGEHDFYFRASGSQRWDVYSKPGAKCKPMGIDVTGIDLTIECDGVTHESNNSGKTWTKAGSV